MALDQVKNFGKVSVSTGYDDDDVTIVLISGDGAKLPDPASGEYNMVWWDATNYDDPADDPRKEIVRVTAKATNTLTILRAQEGTSATIKNTGGSTYKMVLGITAKMITDIQAVIGTPVTNETPSGLINGSNKVYTLANTPSDTSTLQIFLGGMFMTLDEDYSISGADITFVNAPYSGPLRAFYKY